MEKVLNVTYSSSLTNLCEINSSFDTGVLRVCYTGENRNGSSISKEAIERSLPTIYNCPIVCNYDRETDTFGGHDMEVVKDDTGLRIVNITQPVGVIPESSKVWFEDFTEEDGTVNTYLYAEALIWKRQEAYAKLKKDGVVSHSMEIRVKDGENVDGVYVVKDFEFTAFALIGVEPCFESSSLEMFSNSDFANQFALMMQDLKKETSKVFTSNEVDDKCLNDNLTKGGEEVLEEKMEMLAEYGLGTDDIDFAIEEIDIDELKMKLEEIKASKCKDDDDEKKKCSEEEKDDDKPEEEEVIDDEKDGDEPDEKFALTEDIVRAMVHALSEVKIETEYGTCDRYWYVNSDFEAKEIYVCDQKDDWNLYGLKYELNGDNAVIDFDSAKRKKYIIVDFDEGEEVSPFKAVFDELRDGAVKIANLEEKYQSASDTIDSLNDELTKLREFKADIESAEEAKKREEVFAQFSDLVGVEAFEALKENAMELSIDELEEKCYSLRGRMGTAKFTLTNKSPIIKVQKTEDSKEPYGGIFAKYGYDE